jgi:hypothetical protein
LIFNEKQRKLNFTTDAKAGQSEKADTATRVSRVNGYSGDNQM